MIKSIEDEDELWWNVETNQISNQPPPEIYNGPLPLANFRIEINGEVMNFYTPPDDTSECQYNYLRLYKHRNEWISTQMISKLQDT
jgi:hypothetical protein